MLRKLSYIAVTCSAITVLSSCSREEKTSIQPASPHNQGMKKVTTVVVPPAIVGKWKAVKIGVLDKESNKDQLYEVPIGSQLTLPGSKLVIKVENFLPAFTMQGAILTSQSNELTNPAAQVKVFDDGKEIFKGWLYSLYPTTHAFQHPRYGFTLKGFVPSK